MLVLNHRCYIAQWLKYEHSLCSSSNRIRKRFHFSIYLQQIRLKLQLVDGEVKKSKVCSIMKHFVRHISAAINRSASRNIFLKATKTLNLIRHIQQNSSSSPSFDSISSSSSHSPDDFLQEFDLQITNQDVIQT
mgnify:CR=1 FL=1